MHFLLVLLAACLAALIPAGAAHAIPTDPAPADPNPAAAVRFVSTGPGRVLTGGGGFQAPVGFPLDQYPMPGYDPAALGFTGGVVPANPFAAIINVQPFTPPGAPLIQTYCIDLLTGTHTGIPYDPGSWGGADVANLGYITRVLVDNYPVVPTQPSGISPVTGLPLDNNERVAIIQGAIWWFSDRAAPQPTGPFLPFVRAVVLAAIAAGPLPEPQADLRITGPTTGIPGTVTGPYTLEGLPAGAIATLTIANGELFADAGGTVPLSSPATLGVGDQFYLRTPATGTVDLSAVAVVEAATGRALLYAPANPANPLPPNAQRLIVALPGPMRTGATLTVQFSPAPTPAPLPVTGEASPLPTAGVGLALVGLGIAAVMAGRARPRRR